MGFKTNLEDTNYRAKIVPLKGLHKHPNADKLQVVNIDGNNIITGMDAQEGQIYVYFPLECAINKDFLSWSNSFEDKTLNADPNVRGFFNHKCRVRAVKLRGQPSQGYIIPAQVLADWLATFTGESYANLIYDLEKKFDNSEFDSYNDIVICKKYVSNKQVNNSGTGPKGRRSPRVSKLVEGQFKFHFDTSHLGKNLHKIQPDDMIAITWKLHGTSAIAANLLCKRKLDWKDRVFKALGWLFGKPVYCEDYEYLYASRNVIKNEFQEGKGHFYGYDLWTSEGEFAFGNKLHKGETIYYELVGYTKYGGYIQKGFDYGCNVNTDNHCKPYVYRITQTNVDGVVTELQWNQVKERCIQLGVEHVPEIYYGKASFCPRNGVKDEENLGEAIFDALKWKYVCDQDSIFCKNKVPEEGITVRKEGLNIETFKLKSFRFQEMESKHLDEEVIDIEEEEKLQENGTKES